MSPEVLHRDPILTLGASDPAVITLADDLRFLGYDPGPEGVQDVSPQLMGAVREFRQTHEVTDTEGLPPDQEPAAAVGPATWAAVRDAVVAAQAADAEQAAQEALAAEQAALAEPATGDGAAADGGVVARPARGPGGRFLPRLGRG